MESKIIKRILDKSKQHNLLEILVKNLSLSELQSLLLEVFRRRTAELTPKFLFNQYIENRFVQSAKTDPLSIMEFDRLAFSILQKKFEAIELSPVSPLGTSSIIAPVDQNNSIATIRSTEVCSDSTNMLALECAKRRKEFLLSDPRSAKSVNLCASHRVIRGQKFDMPGAFPHFRLFSLCSAGRDEGSHKFEINSLLSHLDFYIELFAKTAELSLNVKEWRVIFSPMRDDSETWLQKMIEEKLSSKYPETSFTIEKSNSGNGEYYSDLRFQIHAKDKQDQEYLLVDGGFTDWTQKLVSNKKERLLISGIGSERLLVCFK